MRETILQMWRVTKQHFPQHFKKTSTKPPINKIYLFRWRDKENNSFYFHISLLSQNHKPKAQSQSNTEWVLQ